jgi:FkbH-like protein
MTDRPLRILLVSDANMGNLAATLRAEPSSPAIVVTEAPYGSVLPTLMDPLAPIWAERPDLSVVWTRPEGVLGGIARAVAGERVPGGVVDQEVDAFTDAVAAAAPLARWTLVPSWVPPFGTRGLGIADLHETAGVRALLSRANHRLTTRLRDIPDCWVVDGAAWAEAAGGARGDRRLWYAGKIPFPTPVFRAAARDIRAFLRAATGRSRKVIILDLDNTLWGGVVGETGWQGLRLGGHDPIGEAFVDFQHALKTLTRRGVVLGIVSKNEEATALEAIREHPDMVLREEDFAGWRINWEDKAANVASLLDELRLGADAAVFIDDQPAERGRVEAALPDVLVPDWSTDPLGSVHALEKLDCFDVLQVSEEDAARSGSYAAERKRRALQSGVSGIEEWLEQLGIVVQIEALTTTNLARATQLLNKTNQMNLSTRRMSESELLEWAAGPGRVFLTIRVADRFSDFGLTGLLSLEQESHRISIVDFVLSCRVMSRRVEEAMVHVAVEHARSVGARDVVLVYRPTERNAPMLAFWQEKSGFTTRDGLSFTWDSTRPYPAPRAIKLVGPIAAGSPA